MLRAFRDHRVGTYPYSLTFEPTRAIHYIKPVFMTRRARTHRAYCVVEHAIFSLVVGVTTTSSQYSFYRHTEAVGRWKAELAGYIRYLLVMKNDCCV